MNTGFRAILLANYRRYPAMQLVDVYKLIHQASLGSEHAVSDQAAAQRWLDQELAGLGSGPDDLLLDPIAPGGTILRIHLRPFLAQGGDPDELLQAFIRTANAFQGSVEVLKSYWADVIRLAGAGELPFSPTEALAFGQEMASLNYPAAHHSRDYRKAYQPAYRVVAREFWSGA